MSFLERKYRSNLVFSFFFCSFLLVLGLLWLTDRRLPPTFAPRSHVPDSDAAEGPPENDQDRPQQSRPSRQGQAPKGGRGRGRRSACRLAAARSTTLSCSTRLPVLPFSGLQGGNIPEEVDGFAACVIYEEPGLLLGSHASCPNLLVVRHARHTFSRAAACSSRCVLCSHCIYSSDR